MLGALSSPHTASVAQLDRVSVSEAEGRGFDSRRARQMIQRVRHDRLQQVSDTTVNKELNLFAHVIDTARREWSIHIENPVRHAQSQETQCNRAWDRRLDPARGGRLAVAAAKIVRAVKIIEFAPKPQCGEVNWWVCAGRMSILQIGSYIR